MTIDKACSSYRASDRMCLDGFITNAACRGAMGCPTCGKDSKTVPMCCNEEWSARLLERTGGKPDWEYVQRIRANGERS
jgi:hypothetical protein